MSGGSEREKKIGLLILTVFIAVTDYLWSFWYFRSRYSTGTLLSISQVSAENLGNMLFQNVAVNLITLLTAAILWLILRRDFGKILGFVGGNRRGHLAAGIAGGIYALLLVAALVWSGISVLALVYQWIYFLVLVALSEEFLFRAVFPWLMEKSRLPSWCAWIVPGVLFGAAHTLVPLVKFGASTLLPELLSGVAGYVLASCGFYALRRWSGTIWLPVFIHAVLDFTGILL